ncbi:hypothetical protein BJ508DRAFT_322005 [Ascobolus immersus RN42]|uniref:Uncharacterized protein n=1 Tax=Ascobolus immersus RN42 TaxID=1160509 RepID=A0A3N4IJM8_ASCIM|nr:hypothetical protein BJ508DRAFT_322005 [Ascobolus immersus RN42]
MARVTRAQAKKTAAQPIILSDDEQSTVLESSPKKARKTARKATPRSASVKAAANTPEIDMSGDTSSQSQPAAKDMSPDLVLEFPRPLGNTDTSDIPYSQQLDRELEFLDTFTQNPAAGIYSAPLSSQTIMSTPAKRKASPSKQAPPTVRRKLLEDRPIAGSPTRPNRAPLLRPLPPSGSDITTEANVPGRSKTLSDFLEELNGNNSPPRDAKSASPPPPTDSTLDGLLNKPSRIIMDSDDEKELGDSKSKTSRRRAGETDIQFKTRTDLEKTLRREKLKDGGNIQDLINIIPLEDRVLTSRKKRLVRKKDIDRAVQGLPEESEEEDEDDEPIDIATEQRKQLETAIKRLNMRERERVYSKTIFTGDQKKTETVREKAYYIRGMVTPLLPHQIICVDWMVNERELSRKAPYGGLLGDAMGLGKTMQCIATMCKNPPPDDYTQDDPHITLIVCPVALVQQWKREIEKHCKSGKFDIYIYHGKDKVKDAAQLRKKQVVITTYQTIALGYPKIYVPEEIPKEERQSYADKEFRKRRGVLHRVRYWRIIFDECHIIRNRATKVSEAAMRLESEMCWCLSGTPIFNSLWDLFPVFSLIDMPRLCNSDFYRNLVGKGTGASMGENAAKTIQIALRAAMMRRTKDDQFMGRPLIELPPKVVKEVFIEFDPDARALYDLYESMARAAINDFAKKDKIGKNYSHILTFLLRLRQLCNHPYLTANELKFWSRHDLDVCLGKCDEYFEIKFGEDALQEFLEAAAQAVHGEDKKPVLEDEKPKVKTEVKTEEGISSVTEKFIKSERSILDDLFAKIGMPHLGLKLEENTTTKTNRPVRALLQRLRESSDVVHQPAQHDPLGLASLEEDENSCPICFDEFSNPVITPCRHIFCRDCIESSIDIAANNGLDYECPVCASLEAPVQTIIEKDDLKLHGARTAAAANRAMAALGMIDKDAERKKQQVKIDKEFKENLQKRFFMSRKLEALRDQLREWRVNRPDDKVVLFSQFTKFLDIIEVVTQAEGWETARYQGDMPMGAREAALDKFKDEPECWIMLTSTKAGGVGLNLTHANLVVCVDLWWNAAIELQAFDRVHRLGQMKDVEVKRLIMENSVETRMLALQEVKLRIAGIALGEGDAKLGKLNLKDLIGLFGSVETDERGRMRVRSDVNRARMPGAYPGMDMGDFNGGQGAGGGAGAGSGEDDEDDDEDEDIDMDDE